MHIHDSREGVLEFVGLLTETRGNVGCPTVTVGQLVQLATQLLSKTADSFVLHTAY